MSKAERVVEEALRQAGSDSAKEVIDIIRKAGYDLVHTTDHYVEIGEHGWAIQHPTACRPNMLACEFTRVAQVRWEEPPAPLGIYKMELDDGIPTLGWIGVGPGEEEE